MRYIGSRLQKMLNEKSGSYADLEKRMRKYRRARKNGGSGSYNLQPFLKDDHNITVYLLTALMKETGKPIDFFIDFEDEERPRMKSDGISGSNNIINSQVTSNDLNVTVHHLQDVLKIKDQLLDEKERNIIQKDAEIANLRKLTDKLLDSFNTSK